MSEAKKTALMAAADILARAEQSERRLKGKLSRKGYGAEEIEGAVERLKERRYLDDAGACQRQFDYLYKETRNSLRRICQKLKERGFSYEHIRACIPEDTGERELAAAKRSLALHFRREAEPLKMRAYLGRQGFSYETIYAALAGFGGAADEY